MGSKRRRGSSKRKRAEPQEELIKALGHPLRIELLALLGRRIASPKELAYELKQKLSNVSYHVRVLAEAGLIELVEEEPVRGSVAHFYKAVWRDLLSSSAWKDLSPEVRSAFFGSTIETLLSELAASLSSGLLDRRDDHLIVRKPLSLDDGGWRKVLEIQASAIEEILKEQKAAQNRVDISDSDVITATLGILFFEVKPDRADASHGW